VSYYSATDQYVVDCVAERAEGLFAYIPEVGTWRRYCEGFWTERQAKEALKELYLAVVAALSGHDEERDRRANHLLIERLSAPGQESGLRLLEKERRLLVPLASWDVGPIRWEETSAGEFVSKRAGREPTFDDSELIAFFKGHLTSEPAQIADFLTRACACRKPPKPPLPLVANPSIMSPYERATRTLLVRDEPLAADLDLLYDALLPILGDYLVPVPAGLWSHWPEALTPEWALLLQGARVVFLDGMEPWQKFPHASLRRFIQGKRIFWRGADKKLHPFRPPVYCVLCGPEIPSGRRRQWDITLQERATSLPGVLLHGGA
jgi:hypothetical protein